MILSGLILLVGFGLAAIGFFAYGTIQAQKTLSGHNVFDGLPQYDYMPFIFSAVFTFISIVGLVLTIIGAIQGLPLY